MFEQLEADVREGRRGAGPTTNGEIPVSPTFVQWAHERAAAKGVPVAELLHDPALRSFAALVEQAPPEELARERERLRLRRELFGGDILAECRAFRDGTHPLAALRKNA